MARVKKTVCKSRMPYAEETRAVGRVDIRLVIGADGVDRFGCVDPVWSSQIGTLLQLIAGKIREPMDQHGVCRGSRQH